MLMKQKYLSRIGSSASLEPAGGYLLYISSTFKHYSTRESSDSYISQIVCRRARCSGPGRPSAPSQVGHAGPAARGPRGRLGARPAHKQGLAHDRRSSLRESERPSARFSLSTNLLWNLSSRAGGAGGLAEPLGLSARRSEAREGGARQ